MRPFTTDIYKRLANALIIATLSLYATSSWASEEENTCSFSAFEDFLEKYLNNYDLQRSHTSSKLSIEKIAYRDNRIYLKEISAGEYGLPKIPKEEDLYYKIISKTQVIQVTLGNKLGSFFKIYTFSPTHCWALIKIQDWSVSLNDASKYPYKHIEQKSYATMQRGLIYESLASLEQYPHSKEFHEIALNNYLNAVTQGSVDAGYQASILSLSGQAPRLSDELIERFLLAASQKDADAAAALSSFYCDQGVASTPPLPCKNPEKSRSLLIKSARMGSIDAVNYLAYTYEVGTLGVQSTEQAAACYKLAASKGNILAKKNLNRLNSQGVNSPVHTACY